MKYFETDLLERHDCPNKYYAVRIWKGRSCGSVVSDHIYVIDEEAAIRHMHYLERLTVIYTDVELTNMMSKIYVRNPLYDEERIDSVLALPYNELVKYGVPVSDFENLKNGISLIPMDEDFYLNDVYQYKLYLIKKGDEKLAKIVLWTKEGEWLKAEKNVMDNLDRFLDLPKAKDLPEPLRSLVFDQYFCEYGMLFIENDEEFLEHWSIEKVEALSRQIDRYGLQNYIEMPARPEDAFEIPDGEPVITAYCGLSGNFNFAGSSEYL